MSLSGACVLFAYVSVLLVLSSSGDADVRTCPWADLATVLQSTLPIQRQCPVAETAEADFKKPKAIDFVFLLEQPFVFNRTKLDYVIGGLRALLQNSQRDCYSDFDIHYAMLTYSLQHPPTTAFFQAFSPLHSQVPLFTDLRMMQDLEANTGLDARILQWQAVNQTLQMVSRVATDGDVVLEDGSTRKLHCRLHADLHVIVVTGLQDSKYSLVTSSREVANATRLIENDILDQLTQLVGSLHFNNNTAFHFFVDSTSKPFTTYIGNPAHSVRYKDCTHFNKALTLKRIISSGETANSVQAHLLVRGIEAQVSHLSELEDHGCTMAINPATWNRFSIHPEFPDKCTRESCPNGFYCPPLHGCVKRQASAAVHSSNSLPEGTFEDKAPLISNFTFSHADLVRPATSKDQTKSSNSPLPNDELSITAPLQTSAPSVSLTEILTGSLDALQWDPEQPFVQELIEKKEPALLRNTVVSKWPALAKWNLSYLSDAIGYESLEEVKHSNSFLTFDPDERAPLKLNITLPFTVANMSTKVFFDCIQAPEHCSDGFKGHYFFSKLPTSLQPDVLPNDLLYNTELDYSAQKQFIWISSPGMITHGHFDQDFNFFVQLIGEKRFTLWSSAQHDLMSVFPRIHPMWHKSRINFRAPDLLRFPQFAKSRAVQVTVKPGDVLFIPPYTWHYVETLTTSVSLSTWSHDHSLYHHMNAIYRHDHKFDLLEDPRGQMFALRLFLDMLIYDLYGFNETTAFFARLLTTRFSGFEHLFPPSEKDPQICRADIPGKIPTCIHVHGYAKLDMAVVGSHFESLSPEVRDILFQDYVEEITAQVVGVKKMLAFFRYCFLGQEYYITESGTDEHRLWDHKDP